MADLEREIIFQHLETICGEVEGVALASRDFELVITGQITEHPAIFIVDLGEADEPENSGRSNQGILTVGVVCVVQGTTDQTKLTELATFERLVLAKLYQRVYDIEEIASFRKTGMSHTSFSKVTPREVHQGIQCEIKFIESITALVSE